MSPSTKERFMVRRIIGCLTLTCLLAAPGWGQSQEIELQKALDKAVDFTIADAPIGEVFQRLSAKTDVDFEIAPDVREFLPYGSQTRLAVTLRNLTLRKALKRMCQQQALRWSPQGGKVRIEPTEALYRMGRRASFDEFKTLGRLHSVTLQPVAKGGSVIEQMRTATDNKDLDLLYNVADEETLRRNRRWASERANEVLPATAAEWLDRLTEPEGWVWYLWGDQIIIIDRLQQTRRQLDRQVSVQYRGASLQKVLLDLARKARLKLSLAPNVMNLLPEQTRTSFNLIMAEATIDQALEVISGATGLVFTPTGEGIRVEPSDMLKQTTTQPARRRSPFWVRLTLPTEGGAEIDVFLRADELPDNLVERIKAERTRFLRQYGPIPDPNDNPPE